MLNEQIDMVALRFGLGRLSNLLKVTQPVKDRIWI